MGDAFNIVLPYFSTPKNYAQVLQRLAGATFWEVYLLTFFLRDNPAVAALFAKVESYGKLGKLISVIPNYEAINVSGVVIALVVARISYSVQLHNHISNVFKIRDDFDVEHILVPLAQAVQCQLDNVLRMKLREHRSRLIRSVFYKYATSGKEETVVDRHDIEQALGAWSSFWMLVEGAAYFLRLELYFHFYMNGQCLRLASPLLSLCCYFPAFNSVDFQDLPRFR